MANANFDVSDEIIERIVRQEIRQILVQKLNRINVEDIMKNIVSEKLVNENIDVDTITKYVRKERIVTDVVTYVGNQLVRNIEDKFW